MHKTHRRQDWEIIPACPTRLEKKQTKRLRLELDNAVSNVVKRHHLSFMLMSIYMAVKYHPVVFYIISASNVIKMYDSDTNT